jgi:hypothetical protein
MSYNNIIKKKKELHTMTIKEFDVTVDKIEKEKNLVYDGKGKKDFFDADIGYLVELEGCTKILSFADDVAYIRTSSGEIFEIKKKEE